MRSLGKRRSESRLAELDFTSDRMTKLVQIFKPIMQRSVSSLRAMTSTLYYTLKIIKIFLTTADQ